MISDRDMLINCMRHLREAAEGNSLLHTTEEERKGALRSLHLLLPGLRAIGVSDEIYASNPGARND